MDSNQNIDSIAALVGSIRNESFLIEFSKTEMILIRGLPSFVKNYLDGFPLFVDGTFDTVPVPFKQLYSFHAKINADTIPIINVLMESRSQTSCKCLIEKLKIKGKQIVISGMD